jgi:LPXTG-motif cell wall-anchored protein
VILRSQPWRALAVASSVLIGILGSAVPVASPATAQTPTVEGSCAWDPDAEEWLVTWTVTSEAPAGASTYRLAGIEATPESRPVEEITTSPEGTFPHGPGEPLVGVQRLPEGTTAASLAVLAEWDTLQQQEQRGEIAIPTECAPPPELANQWALDCDALTITVQNPTDHAVTLTFAPNTGSSVPVEVASGGSATVEFPPSEGLAVDVLLDGQSIVEPTDPIEITAADLAELECDEEVEGGGGGLPATGTSTLIVVIGALALLAIGTVLYLVARRRRIRFTA